MNETIQNYLNMNESHKDVGLIKPVDPDKDRDCLVFHGVKVDEMELVSGVYYTTVLITSLPCYDRG